ncbi:hypothetical protein QBC42DRAFT_249390 [Cladorrhinum samala]|uniref:Uncharacterized protein n=1 Tax=Cladorrhinum samala TaxID=585594 RepID=A0AAV9HWI8_9PEZI|nr:hypothetical protein QBC42DRAFT_249390 [Cladorrhinum samala]
MSPKSGCPHAGHSGNGQAISQPDGWTFRKRHDVLGHHDGGRHGSDGPGKHQPHDPAQEVPLGVLAMLEGKSFNGKGLNMIFRPNSGPPPLGTQFPKPVDPAPPTGTSDNVLELNLFVETLTFGKAVGAVPNRGFSSQGDINLNAIQYLQTIADVTNPRTGRADGDPAGHGIHVENGMFMHVPGTGVNPKLGETIVRCGTIPHGVAINLQGLESGPLNPSTVVAGAPAVPRIDPTPFVAGQPDAQANQVRFPSQTAAAEGTPRIPQDLSLFIKHGTITQAVLDDPAVLLTEANRTRNIIRTQVLDMSSTARTGIKTGGGVLGNAFLDGDLQPDGTAAAPNARPVQVEFTLYVETVQYEVPVPAFHPGHGHDYVEHEHEGIKFRFFPPREVARHGRRMTVNVTELQYTQIVMLQFGGLTWPHPTVSTLKPEVWVVEAGDAAWREWREW